jgi:hypothetical protein
MAHCPAYQGSICSLCCTLDARCGDLCKPQASLSSQWQSSLRWLLPKPSWAYLDKGLGTFLLLMLVIAPLLACVLGSALPPGVARPGRHGVSPGLARHHARHSACCLLQAVPGADPDCRAGGVVGGTGAPKSGVWRRTESNRQTSLLMREIELHRQTDAALQQARSRSPSRRGRQPTRPTRPKAATSARSAMNCAHRSTAFWVTPS